MHPGPPKGLDDPGEDSSNTTDSVAEAANTPRGEPPGGVLFARWASLRIPIGGLVIRALPDGTIQTDPVIVEVTLDTWPHWLEIAIGHLKVASEAHKALVEAHESDDGDAQNRALNDEFQASMQAICASAFAVDALCGSLNDVFPISEATKDGWAHNRTPRAGRILDAVHRVAKLSNAQAKSWRKALKMMFEFRNWAVHPPRDFRRPLLHPILQVGVDWRFVVYREENARNAVAVATEVLMRTFAQPREQKAVQDWAKQQAPILQSLLAENGITITDSEHRSATA
jgi:hypothetical protein